MGFCGISRKRLLGLLQQRADELGVHQFFQRQVDDDSEFRDADLIVAGDGVNSRTRLRHAEVFRPVVDVRKCRFMWLGTTQKFDAFTFAFERTEHGWFQIHAYQFSRGSLDGDRRNPGGDLGRARARRLHGRTLHSLLRTAVRALSRRSSIAE